MNLIGISKRFKSRIPFSDGGIELKANNSEASVSTANQQPK